MEFFQEIQRDEIDVVSLKNLLSIKSLTDLCASITALISEQGDAGDIYCIWGEFSVKREELRYGVRFSLLNCPHALAWSVTVDEVHGNVIIHCTTDKKEQDPGFVDSIEEFVTDWAAGLEKAL